MKGEVLIVDDNKDLATLMRARLERAGYLVAVVHDGAGALDLLRRPYDVILLDPTMPVVSGFEVLQLLADRAPAMLRRVIVFTAHDPYDPAMADVLRLPIFRHVVKPSSWEELLDTVRGCVEQRSPV